MAGESNELALMRVLAAVAWADGELSAEESQALHHLAGELGLKDGEAAEIEAIVSAPVSRDRFEDLVSDLRAHLDSPEDRRRLVEMVEQIASADREMRPAEREYLDRVRRWMVDEASAAETGSGWAGRLRGALSSVRDKAGAVLATASAAQGILDALGTSRGAPAGMRLDPAQRLHVTLFGALIHRVIRADGVVRPEEQATLRRVLAERFGFSSDAVHHVLELIDAQVATGADRQKLCAEFNRLSDMDGRLRLLECLFLLGWADGSLSEAEEREIRLISNFLWIEPQEYVRVRLEAERRLPDEHPGAAGGAA